jgi:adenylate cyclase
MPAYRLVSYTGDQKFELPPGRTLLVGRAVTSDIAIYDPTISRRHAELTVAPEGVQVRDLGSSNGTCINGTRVSAGRLSPSDSITFGKVLFQLERTDGAEPRPSQTLPDSEIVRQMQVSGGLPPDLASRAADDDLQARKLSLLLDISQKLAGELDLDRLLGRVADVTFEVMNVDRVSILLRNETTGELVPRISRSRLGDTEHQHVPRSIADKVVRERVAVLSHNAAADSRFKSNSIMMQSVQSAMCSPLMASADKVLGLLYVDNVTTTNSFSDDDLQFLVAFAGLAAVGIQSSSYAEQLRREAVVRSNFERYFAPNVASEIAQQEGVIRLGGDKRSIAILFSDIRGFTTMSETLGPDVIAQLLTDYFTEMVDIVFEYGGTLDKFIGDAIMALWGAPIAHPDDPDRAIEAAVAMQRALGTLNTRWRAADKPELGVGVGIAYGEVFAGNIGSHRRLEYTVIGDAVNIAARLCAEAGPGEILVSDSLRRITRRAMRFDPIPAMSLKGKAQAVTVYRVQSDTGVLRPPATATLA